MQILRNRRTYNEHAFASVLQKCLLLRLQYSDFIAYCYTEFQMFFLAMLIFTEQNLFD